MPQDASGRWVPHSSLDLATATPAAFKMTVAEFNEYAKTQPLEPLEIKNGWYVVTPQIAEDWLKRNRKNRPTPFEAVSTYAMIMADDGWKKTGQPIIFNVEGLLDDGQTRLWAAYLSGKSFPTYVVTDSPNDIDDKFAFIDQGKTRSVAETLETAGYNGLSAQIGATAELAIRYEAGRLNFRPRRVKSVTRMTKYDFLMYVRNHPGLSEAAHLLYGTYRAAAYKMGVPRVAILLTWLIAERWDAEVVDTFMRALVRPDLPKDHPIKVLQTRFEESELADEKMPVAERLAYLIKTFNIWKSGKKFGRAGLTLTTDEPFPEILDPGDLAPTDVAAD